ncbi:MAG TPA: NADH-quinone oxidoreductase subunit C [Candidatus Atribacteria bacterium]|nr:MAG: NADH-quinone oxidoreductase subunit C [Candidatus Nealsonbacteria bacterium]HDK26653.1 NADH-quinone oxidoreductase subunit C [Candidatus Atribacteria bacterium]
MKSDLKKEKTILEKIKRKFGREGTIQRAHRVWISIDKEELLDWAKWLRQEGFIHLSAISVSDWLEEKKYKVAYLLWSFEDNILLVLNTKIDRENPVIDSIIPLWGNNAQAHERENWEFFGINFKGNPNLIPLFTENWQGAPPFGKDFNWQEYVRDEYYNKENKRERGYYED